MEDEPYLPAVATPVEACEWLNARTSERWTIGRLLDAGLMPWFWLDWTPDAPPEVFNGHTEGYLAPVIFAGDDARIRADRTVRVTMTRTFDGDLFRIEPGMIGSVDDLRFKSADIESLVSGPAQSGKPGATSENSIRGDKKAVAVTRTHLIEDDITEGSRTDALTAFIKQAYAEALDPNDNSSCWVRFTDIVRDLNKSNSLFEVVDGEVKYPLPDESGCDTLSRKNFNDRLRRVRRKAKAR